MNEWPHLFPAVQKTFERIGSLSEIVLKWQKGQNPPNRTGEGDLGLVALPVVGEGQVQADKVEAPAAGQVSSVGVVERVDAQVPLADHPGLVTCIAIWAHFPPFLPVSAHRSPSGSPQWSAPPGATLPCR